MQFDAIVVGSGLCGTLAARRLEASGAKLRVLEAGPAVPGRPLPADVPGFQRAVKPFTEVKDRAWKFRAPTGFEWHRVRAQGGRTLVWGGWMERPTQDYFDARRREGAPWPEALTRLAPWVREAEGLLEVRSGKAGRLHRQLWQLGYPVGVKRECVLPTGPRMMTAVDLSLTGRVQCDAAVLRLERLSRGIAVHLAQGPSLSARQVILAASPVETARILEASLSPGRRRFALADHLIAGVIAIGARRPVTSHPLGAAESSAVIHPEAGAQVRFTTEVRGPTPLEQLDAEDLAQLGFTPEEAAHHSFYVVFAMGETDPLVPRHVELETRTRDGLGRPVPRFVARRHTEGERRLAEQMNAQCLTIAQALAVTPAQAFPIYDALDFSSGGHETGTCLDRVDATGQVNALAGVFVADGSTVPAATDRHPSLTLAANALRVAATAAAVRC